LELQEMIFIRIRSAPNGWSLIWQRYQHYVSFAVIFLSQTSERR